MSAATDATTTDTTSKSTEPRAERPPKRKLGDMTAESTDDSKASEPPTKRSNAPKRVALFVTGNAGKLAEVQKYLGESVGKHLVNRKIDLTEIQGTAKEILERKLKEAKAVVGDAAQAILVEDTNLCLKHYGGMPGPYIKDFLGSAHREGIIKMANGGANRDATAICYFGFIDCATNEVTIFSGECEGTIATEIRGDSGFGWDPCFAPKHEIAKGRTFAEMTMDEKNQISHRALALQKLKPFIVDWVAKKDTAADDTATTKEAKDAKDAKDETEAPVKVDVNTVVGGDVSMTDASDKKEVEAEPATDATAKTETSATTDNAGESTTASSS